MSTKPPRIAIIGAGPGGLTLLNILARHGISATLYDWETPTEKLRLGGCLDLLPNSGQVALKAAGLCDEAMKHARLEPRELRASDRTGVPFVHFVPPPDFAASPEIDRATLHKILLHNAPEGSIKWNHTFVEAAPVPGTAQWELTLSCDLDDVKDTVDLVVGADGWRSRVRPLVSDATHTFTGVTGIGGLIDADEDAERDTDGRVSVSAMFRSEEEYEFPNFTDPAGAVADVSTRFEGWAPWLLKLLNIACPLCPRSYFTLPVGHTWPHRAGVTLLGDAMNLMPPYTRAGANIAMLAAEKIGAVLVELNGRPVDEVDARIAEYEKEMCEIAAAEAAKAEKIMKMFMFGEDGAREFLASIASKV